MTESGETGARAEAERPRQAGLPSFAVDIAAPDLSPWLAGNTGVAGFTSFAAEAPGPHVVLLALMHGNELAGAIALDEMLRAGVRPARGRLTLGFANLRAFARFDPAQPTLSRFVEEDLNRLWDPEVLASSRRSAELDRAREMRPVVEAADVVLDLHSMLWPSEALILCGATERGRALATAIGVPDLVVADRGHLGGRRLIDAPRFCDPDGAAVAVLVEAGQHWAATTVATARRAVAGLLRRTGLLAGRAEPAGTVRCAEVTDVVTAATAGFAFVRAFRGGEVVARRNTVIALDGETEIRTPYDDCLLVMPSLRPSRGHTAVRLARLLD
jgi:predicted deacylase